MARKDDIVFAFDLDGTIADYGKPVTSKVADFLNTLGKIYVISGGGKETIEKNTKLLINCERIGLRDMPGNTSLDCSILFGKNRPIDKGYFNNSHLLQIRRRSLVALMRQYLPDQVFIGGRSTIDIMNTNKGDVVKKIRGRVVYFYDCKWGENESLNNDIPAIKHSYKAIKTSHKTVIKDVEKCLKTL